MLMKKIPAARKFATPDNFSHGPSLNNTVLESDGFAFCSSTTPPPEFFF